MSPLAELLGLAAAEAAEAERRAQAIRVAAQACSSSPTVADVYQLAWLLRRPCTQAVARHFGLSYDVAAKRVQRAREAGELPPTIRGVARGDVSSVDRRTQLRRRAGVDPT